MPHGRMRIVVDRGGAATTNITSCPSAPPSYAERARACIAHPLTRTYGLQCQVEGKPCEGPKNTKCCSQLKCAGEGSQWYPKDEYDHDVCALQLAWPVRYAMGHLYLERFRPTMSEVRYTHEHDAKTNDAKTNERTDGRVPIRISIRHAGHTQPTTRGRRRQRHPPARAATVPAPTPTAPAFARICP